MLNNKILIAAVCVISLALALFLGVKTRNALQEYHYIGKSERDTFVIQGQGKVVAKPDVAMIQLGVTTEGKTVKEIQGANTEKMNSIISSLKEMDIKPEDIKTENYNLSPKYDWTDGKQVLIGYTVTQNVRVKVRNLDKAGDVIARGGELGANQIGGVQFIIDDPKVLESQARDKAIDDAKQKAEVLAKKLGLEVARVVSFSEYGGAPVPQPIMMMEKAVANDAALAAPQVEPGSQEVVSNVSVTFEVR